MSKPAHNQRWPECSPQPYSAHTRLVRTSHVGIVSNTSHLPPIFKFLALCVAVEKAEACGGELSEQHLSIHGVTRWGDHGRALNPEPLHSVTGWSCETLIRFLAFAPLMVRNGNGDTQFSGSARDARPRNHHQRKGLAAFSHGDSHQLDHWPGGWEGPPPRRFVGRRGSKAVKLPHPISACPGLLIRRNGRCEMICPAGGSDRVCS